MEVVLHNFLFVAFFALISRDVAFKVNLKKKSYLFLFIPVKFFTKCIFFFEAGVNLKIFDVFVFYFFIFVLL